MTEHDLEEDYEDVPEYCPYCEEEDCTDHLLACFDVTFADQGEGNYGVGVISGALYDVKEIGEVLEQARRAWVRSMRVNGNPEAPDWIAAAPGFQDYFDALGDAGGFEVEDYTDDEDAASDLSGHTDYQSVRAREFLETVLRECGWSEETTSEEVDIPIQSTIYLHWWDAEPKKVAEALQALLRRVLDEAKAVDDGAPTVGEVLAVSNAHQRSPLPNAKTDAAPSRALRMFLAEELRHFGADPAYRALPGAVRGAYEPASRNLAVPERTGVYDEIVALVEAAQLDPHALIPVAVMDPHGPLASRAAIDVCMLLPRSLGEPTAGMEHLGSLLLKGNVENRGAVFGGLLCLGDRRAHPWLLRVRDTLAVNEVDQFSRTATGLLSSAAIEFVLDWMEERRRGYEDHVFGALAAWMVNQRTAARVPLVITGERAIPAGIVGADEEYRRLAPVQFSDYVETIAARLIDIERAEPEPKCMGHVLGVWGVTCQP